VSWRDLRLLLWGVCCCTIVWNYATMVGVPDSVGRHDCRALMGLRLGRRCWIAQFEIATGAWRSCIGVTIGMLLLLGRVVQVLLLLRWGRSAGEELLRFLGRVLLLMLVLLLVLVLGR
jgi:hypothetical protein